MSPDMFQKIREEYIEKERKSGIKPGDIVRVTRRANDYDGGWLNTWEKEMSEMIGEELKVSRIADHGLGISLYLEGFGIFCFPYFVLEKIGESSRENKDHANYKPIDDDCNTTCTCGKRLYAGLSAVQCTDCGKWHY